MFIPGDLVKLKNGFLGYVMDSPFGDIIVLNNGQFLKESSYDENGQAYLDEFSIIEIREPRFIYDYDLKHFDNCPLIWSKNSGI